MKTIVLRLLERAGERYPVELLVDDGRADWLERAAETAWWPSDFGDTWPAGAQPSRLLLQEADSSEAFAEVGRGLYGLLARARVGTTWEELQQQYPNENTPDSEGLRVLLEVRPPELRALPWELMHRDARALFTRPSSPCARAALRVLDPKPPDLPMRVLVAVGSRSADILGEDEVGGLLGALGEFRGLVDWDVLWAPTEERFFDTYDRWRPHVLHFIGHARILAGTPSLEFQHWDLTAQKVANVFNRPGRLAVLNACHTATPGAAGQDQLRASDTLAEAFLGLGFLAVVAMQGEIESPHAAAFAAELYRQLATGVAVDQAVAGGRQAIYRMANEDSRRNWALPRLVLAAPPDRVLGQPELMRDMRTRISGIADFNPIRPFVDRTEQRHRVWVGLDPAGFDLDPRPLLVVTGKRRIGKTWLLWHCLRTWMVRDRTVRYVSFERADQRTHDLLAALVAIRQGSRAAGLEAPLDVDRPGAFAGFDAHVDALVKRRQAVRHAGLVKLDVPPDQRASERLVEEVVERFAEGLRAMTATCPLFIALDHVEGVEASWFQQLCDRLLVRFGTQDLPGIRSVIAVPSDATGTHLTEPFRAGPLEVVGIDAADARLLAREYLLHSRDDPRVQRLTDVDRQDMIDFFARRHASGPWEPATLAKLLEVLALSGRA